jgi:hypothetical protein
VNIFYLNPDPKICAEQHVDKHAVKMVLEYAQLLSTAHRVFNGVPDKILSATGRQKTVYRLPDNRDSILYAATHINHPSAIWVRQSRDNYAWLWNLLQALCKEYTYRYAKVHKVEREGLLEELRFVPCGIPEHPKFTEPTPAMPDEFKVPKNSIQSYKNYYIGAKARLASWKNRNVPEWFVTT